MRSIRDITTLENVPVLVRASLNVPVENGKVTNEYRLQHTLPTLRYLAERGSRVIVVSHVGEQGAETLKPVVDALKRLIPRVSFFGESVGAGARAAARDLLPGHILVLENLRRHAGERANDPAFARELASLADVFVEDSFDTCHREHASIVGVPKFLPSYAGLQLEDEVRELSRALSPEHPALAAIGGMKFSTKEPVLAKLLATYDKVFVGGALASDFLKAEGTDVGKSLVSGADPEAIKKLLDNPKLVLPVDSVSKDGVIVDHGPGTRALLADLASRSKTILWNGPFGEYEKGFGDTTDAFAEAVAASGAYSVVGGGDTVAAIEHLGLLSHFSFVSTGGGAMLDFLARGTLPGIAVLG